MYLVLIALHDYVGFELETGLRQVIRPFQRETWKERPHLEFGMCLLF
jgi:hypothetical protein